MARPPITAEQVRALAELSKLELDAAEVERMRRDLDSILGYVEALDALDTRDVPPTTHPIELETPLRVDRIVGVLSVADVVRAAPAHEGGALCVPKVIE